MGILKEWVEKKAGGEEILGVTIGEFAGEEFDEEEFDDGKEYEEEKVTGHLLPTEKRNIVLSWQEGKTYLAYSFHDGFGGVECHAITAWTASKVIFVSQYDGSTRIFSVPRNPCPHEPIMPGG